MKVIDCFLHSGFADDSEAKQLKGLERYLHQCQKVWLGDDGDDFKNLRMNDFIDYRATFVCGHPGHPPMPFNCFSAMGTARRSKDEPNGRNKANLTNVVKHFDTYHEEEPCYQTIQNLWLTYLRKFAQFESDCDVVCD